MDLLFGTAYYPEYMRAKRISEDIQMMKNAGMNTVRIAESTWSTLEPIPDVYDFSYIDEVLQHTKKEGMNVIVGTPTYAVPSWLVNMDQDVMVKKQNGQAQYGHRQLFNLYNPVFRKRAEKIIRRLVEHTVHWKNVIGFQIDNETKLYGNMSDEVQSLFVKYLKEKYKTTEKLNKVFGLAYWSNSIADWEYFPDMRGCCNGGLAAEYEKFQRSLVADYLNWQAAIVNEYRREDQFITHNFDFEWKKFGADIAQDGYSYGVQPEVNHYESSKCLTIAGADIYHPTQDDLTGAEISFCGDSIRCLKNSNYLVLECQAQAFKYWTPYPGQLRLHAYSHLASGGNGQLYWNWHSIHNGFETYWRGLLSHDLKPNPAYEEASIIGEEWKRVGEILVDAVKENQIALLVDNHSLTACKWFPIDRDISYNDTVRWMYDALYEMNLECDVLDVHALSDPAKYKMIVTPALYSASEELLDKLKKFVAGGGVLVSSFKSFVADEHLSVYADIQPHILHECFGMYYNQFTDPGRTTLSGRPVKYFMELLKTENAETLISYEHKYWKDYAAVTRNQYEKGIAYYVGCWMEKDALKKVLKNAVESAGITQLPETIVWPVIVKNCIGNSGEKLHYFFNYCDEDKEILYPYKCGKEILSGKMYSYGEGISLKDWDVKIFEETQT